MQYTNGNAMKPDHVNSLSQSDESTAENEQAANPPAMVFQNGQVLTRIWANPNHWGDITWKVDQLRVKSPTARSKFARNLFLSDLWDAMRGLYRSHRWITKIERRKRWTVFGK